MLFDNFKVCTFFHFIAALADWKSDDVSTHLCHWEGISRASRFYFNAFNMCPPWLKTGSFLPNELKSDVFPRLGVQAEDLMCSLSLSLSVTIYVCLCFSKVGIQREMYDVPSRVLHIRERVTELTTCFLVNFTSCVSM